MTYRCRPARATLALIASFAGLVSTSPAKAQAWADNNYGYRRPLSITTNVPTGMGVGDVVAYPYAPNSAPFLYKTRGDGQDFKIFYSPDGTTNIEPPQKVLPMGPSGRVLFSLQAAVPPKPYSVNETIAGKTDYDSLPKGPALTFGSLNSGTVTVTLPFPVTLRDRTSNDITIAIDGYIGLGSTDPGRPTTTVTGADKYIIMPFQSNFSTRGGNGQGVYYTADSTQAVIKWELQASSTVVEPIAAKFACIIKADGTIRFVYGTPCQMSGNYDLVGGPEGTDPVRYGIGVGDPSSRITQPTFDSIEGVNFGTPSHDDITYTQTSSTQSITGYWIYYGNEAETGTRIALTSGIQGCDFSDGALHGWKSMNMAGQEGAATADVRISNDPSFGNELRFAGGDAPLYYLPMMYWGDMTPTANGISYVKLRTNGQHGILHRFNTQQLVSNADFSTYPAGADVPGLGVCWNNWGTALPIVSSVQANEEVWGDYSRRHTSADVFGSSQPYNQPSISTYQYNVMATMDNSAGHTIVSGKAWPSNEVLSEPSTWYVTGDSFSKSPAVQPLPAGQMALYNYRSVVYMKWAYLVTNPNAESLSYTLGTESTIVAPPSIINGTVTERFSHKPQPGATVTLMDATGHYLKSAVTDSDGVYGFAIPGGGTFGIGATLASAGIGARSTTPIVVAASATVTRDLVAEVLVNGDMEIPNATNSKPDGWDWNTRWTGITTTAINTYTRDQNHTPGGFWALQVQNPNPQSAGQPDNIETTAGSGFDNPLIPCDVTLSAWVRSDTEDLGTRLRTFTAGWQGAGANGDGTANAGGQWKRFKASPVLANGELPLNTWTQISTTNHYASNPVHGINICFYVGDFLSRPVSGKVWIDDVAVTVTPKYMVISQVVDDLGQPVANPWMGTIKYGALFANPIPGSKTGRDYIYYGTNTPVSFAAWQGPLSRVPTGLSPNGALVATKTVTPEPYDGSKTTPTVTLALGKATNVLGAGTVALVNADSTPASQWPAYLIDQRIDKTGLSELGDSTNPADWVQIERNSGPVLAGKLWDGKIDDEANGWGSGGLKGILSKDGDTGIPDRYRTSTVDIDMGATQSIDQLEFGYFYAVDKVRVWVSNTPFVWNVELPNSAAVLDTTTDATSIKDQGFVSSNKPYDSNPLGAYQVYRLATPATGRYLRFRQDGAPYDDGHQILLELRAMHSTAPAAITTADVLSALQIAAGLSAGPLTTDAQFTRLDADVNNKIDILDAIKLSTRITR